MEIIGFFLLVVIMVLLLNLKSEISEIKSELRNIMSRDEKSWSQVDEPDIDIAVDDELYFETAPEPELPPEIPPVPPVVVIPPVPPSPMAEAEPATMGRTRNIERLIGENLFSKIGILVLIIGVSFFVKYAIDRDWINEVARTLLGMAAGLGLWAVAYRLRDNYRKFSSLLAGGGFAICFASVGIGYNLYSLFGSALAMGILVALTAAMVAVALRFDRKELAVTALIGGFVAPFIAGGSGGNVFFLFGYMALLDVAMFVVTLRKNWLLLPPLSCLFTYVASLTVIATPAVRGSAGFALLFFVLYLVLFSLPLVTVLRRDGKKSSMTWLLTAAMVLNDFAYIGFAMYLVRKIGFLEPVRGIVALAGAVLNLIIFFRYYRTAVDRVVSNILLATACGFILIAIFMQFSDPCVRIVSLAVYASLTAWLFCHTGRRLYLVVTLVISVPLVSALIITGIVGDECFWGAPVSVGASYLLSGIALWVAAVIVKRYLPVMSSGYVAAGRFLFVASLWCGAVLMLMGAGFIYYHYFLYAAYRGVALLSLAAVMLVVTLAFRHDSYGAFALPAIVVVAMHVGGYTGDDVPLLLYVPQYCAIIVLSAVLAVNGFDRFCKGLPAAPLSYKWYMVYYNVSAVLFALLVTSVVLSSLHLGGLHSAGISVTLALAGAVQIALGMRLHSRLLRVIALCTFGVVILKLGVYDLWRMAPVGRIVVFILLGAILLVVSFFYQRLRGVLLDDESRH